MVIFQKMSGWKKITLGKNTKILLFEKISLLKFSPLSSIIYWVSHTNIGIFGLIFGQILWSRPQSVCFLGCWIQFWDLKHEILYSSVLPGNFSPKFCSIFSENWQIFPKIGQFREKSVNFGQIFFQTFFQLPSVLTASKYFF